MLNKIQLIGYVGREPDLRYTPQGKAVTRFSLAVSRRSRDTSGERFETTQWFSIVAWERLAEICAEYVQTGSQIYLEGRVESRSFTDRDGHSRTSWEVIASDLQLLGRSASSTTRLRDERGLDAASDVDDAVEAGEADRSNGSQPAGEGSVDRAASSVLQSATAMDARMARSAQRGSQWIRVRDVPSGMHTRQPRIR